jgi:hypothetical protein
VTQPESYTAQAAQGKRIHPLDCHGHFRHRLQGQSNSVSVESEVCLRKRYSVSQRTWTQVQHCLPALAAASDRPQDLTAIVVASRPVGCAQDSQWRCASREQILIRTLVCGREAASVLRFTSQTPLRVGIALPSTGASHHQYESPRPIAGDEVN